MWAFISPCAFSTAVLHMQALKARQSPKILAHKWGGGGGHPLGVFNFELFEDFEDDAGKNEKTVLKR